MKNFSFEISNESLYFFKFLDLRRFFLFKLFGQKGVSVGYGGILPHSGHGSYMEVVTAPQYRQRISSSLKLSAATPSPKPSARAETKTDPLSREDVKEVFASLSPCGIVILSRSSLPLAAKSSTTTSDEATTGTSLSSSSCTVKADFEEPSATIETGFAAIRKCVGIGCFCAFKMNHDFGFLETYSTCRY